MIRKLLRRVFNKRAANAIPEPVTVPVQSHGVRREDISPAARKVCDTLQDRGFKAYVVGGAVRDLMLGIEPKDFDVATNATPDQVRDAFRRSRIIGRRFRIVHVMSGPETIEVSTFRALHDSETQTDEHGREARSSQGWTRQRHIRLASVGRRAAAGLGLGFPWRTRHFRTRH